MRQQIVGPRGGISNDEVSCYTCLCVTTCQRTKFKDLGCHDWVSVDGRSRIATEKKEVNDGSEVVDGPVSSSEVHSDSPLGGDQSAVPDLHLA